jgi:2-polyprenyl-3-methyl-5-hydroxy-6-metoxy-1,4-benzoquinol methylase
MKLKFNELMKAPIANLHQMRVLELVLSNLNLTKDDSVIEIGIGNGFETFILSKRAKEVVGIDISEPLIRFLNENIRLANVEFYAMDATKEPPKEFRDAFDKCVCLEVLEHVEDPKALLDFIQKTLRKGGGGLGMTFPINERNKKHGMNFFTSKDVYDLFNDNTLSANIRIVKLSKFGSLTNKLYKKVQNILGKKPPRETDIFDNTIAFEMLRHPKRIYWLYKLGIIILFKISAPSYHDDEYGKKALIVAYKV